MVEEVPLKKYVKKAVRAAERRAGENGREFDITTEGMLDTWNEQEGDCALSGMPMTRIKGKGKGVNHTNGSIDRRDNDQGYTEENSQWLCAIVNDMKGKMPEEEFKLWAKRIARNSEEEERSK